MKQFLRFCVVGTLGFLVDVGVLYASAGLLGWYAARALSFAAAVTATYLLNRRFTFRSAAAPGSASQTARQYLRYVVSMLGGAAVNYLAYVLVLHYVPTGAGPAIGVAAGSVAGLFVNFAAARWLVFRSRPGML